MKRVADMLKGAKKKKKSMPVLCEQKKMQQKASKKTKARLQQRFRQGVRVNRSRGSKEVEIGSLIENSDRVFAVPVTMTWRLSFEITTVLSCPKYRVHHFFVS